MGDPEFITEFERASQSIVDNFKYNIANEPENWFIRIPEFESILHEMEQSMRRGFYQLEATRINNLKNKRITTKTLYPSNSEIRNNKLLLGSRVMITCTARGGANKTEGVVVGISAADVLHTKSHHGLFVIQFKQGLVVRTRSFPKSKIFEVRDRVDRIKTIQTMIIKRNIQNWITHIRCKPGGSEYHNAKINFDSLL